MSSKSKPRGPWIHRFLIRLFTLVFAVLVFWVLGFFVDDIESIKGPDWQEIEKEHVDQALVERAGVLKEDIAGLKRQVDAKREEKQFVSDRVRNLQQTIQQLIQLQKLTIEQAKPFSDEEQANLTASLAHFHKSQAQYQDHHTQLTTLSERKRALENELRTANETMDQQREPAREEYNRLRDRHNVRLAILQLAILLPLLGASVFFVMKKRGYIYYPLFLAFGGATLLKVALVIHEYFPSRVFKYLLIFGLLIAVARFLIHFIKVVAFPKAQWLTKQYREAYERFLCPICEYPIRTGPRRYLFWTRRTVNKVVAASRDVGKEEPYACPSCGTRLFEQCSACHSIRHSLLPHCRSCNAEKPIEGSSEEA